jgi:hypothetical protein
MTKNIIYQFIVREKYYWIASGYIPPLNFRHRVWNIFLQCACSMICIDRFRPRPASNLSPCPELPFAATADHATSAAWTRWARTHAPSLRLCFYMTEMASHSFKKKKRKKIDGQSSLGPGPWLAIGWWYGPQRIAKAGGWLPSTSTRSSRIFF